MNTLMQANLYAFFGYNINDDSQVGYYGTNGLIVDDLSDARLFPDKNLHHKKGFGTPVQWLELINSDFSLNHGYKFHLVKTNKKDVCKQKSCTRLKRRK